MYETTWFTSTFLIRGLKKKHVKMGTTKWYWMGNKIFRLFWVMLYSIIKEKNIDRLIPGSGKCGITAASKTKAEMLEMLKVLISFYNHLVRRCKFHHHLSRFIPTSKWGRFFNFASLEKFKWSYENGDGEGNFTFQTTSLYVTSNTRRFNQDEKLDLFIHFGHSILSLPSLATPFWVGPAIALKTLHHPV